MFEKILLGFDGSPHSLRAAAIAGDLARVTGAKILRIAAVFDPIPAYLGEPYFGELAAARTKEAQGLIETAKGIIGEIPGEIHEEVVAGQPADAMLRIAETRGSDLIVIGARGTSVLGGLMLGGQSHKIIHLAVCPVMVVR